MHDSPTRSADPPPSGIHWLRAQAAPPRCSSRASGVRRPAQHSFRLHGRSGGLGAWPFRPPARLDAEHGQAVPQRRTPAELVHRHTRVHAVPDQPDNQPVRQRTGPHGLAQSETGAAARTQARRRDLARAAAGRRIPDRTRRQVAPGPARRASPHEARLRILHGIPRGRHENGRPCAGEGREGPPVRGADGRHPDGRRPRVSRSRAGRALPAVPPLSSAAHALAAGRARGLGSRSTACIRSFRTRSSRISTWNGSGA